MASKAIRNAMNEQLQQQRKAQTEAFRKQREFVQAVSDFLNQSAEEMRTRSGKNKRDAILWMRLRSIMTVSVHAVFSDREMRSLVEDIMTATPLTDVVE